MASTKNEELITTIQWFIGRGKLLQASRIMSDVFRRLNEPAALDTGFRGIVEALSRTDSFCCGEMYHSVGIRDLVSGFYSVIFVCPKCRRRNTLKEHGPMTLQTIRELRGYTLSEVATETGLSLRTLRRWEADPRRARYEPFLKLLKFYRVRLDDVILGPEPMSEGVCAAR